MSARILDAVGVAALVGFLMISYGIKAHAATKVGNPVPTGAPYTPPCNDPSIPWYAKLDCYFL